MATKSLWLADQGSGGSTPLPVEVIDYQASLSRLPDQIAIEVEALVFGTDVHPGYCLLLGQCATATTINLPGSPDATTILAETGVSGQAARFAIYVEGATGYASIDTNTLLRGVAITGSNISEGKHLIKVAVSGLAWCVLASGAGRYVEFPKVPGPGTVTATATENKLVGLVGGIKTPIAGVTVGLVSLGGGGAGGGAELTVRVVTSIDTVDIEVGTKPLILKADLTEVPNYYTIEEAAETPFTYLVR